MAAKLLGIDEAITTCDCCGKKNLKLTVALEIDGEVVHYGRDCAGAALYGRKDRKNGIRAEEEARVRAKVQPVIDAVTRLMGEMGWAYAKDAGNAMGKKVWVRGSDVAVFGTAGMSKLTVVWPGGYENIPINQEGA